METKDNNDRNVADLLAAIDAGDKQALEELVTLVYPDLKRLAHFQLAGERPNHTLNTTAIVHEAFVRLAGGQRAWVDRAHFLRAASKVMRHLLVDHARKRRAEKRGGGLRPVSLDVEKAEKRMAAERSVDTFPDRSFEVRWALTVVRHSMEKLEAEFEAADQGARFALLRGFMIGDAPTLSYGDIAGRLDLSENAVKSMVRRLRKRFGVVLRAEVAQTIDRREDVDEELRYLLRTLESRQSGPRPGRDR